jgi:hypothetical protein
MSVPIIYSPHSVGLKKNTLDYLFVPLSIASVVKSNPTSDVLFLNVNDNYPLAVTGVIDIDARGFYNSACAEIRQVYKHLSTNQPEFELFCMERFFVIREFMRRENIDWAFLVESDVLLFENLNALLKSKGGICSNRVHLSEKKCISLAYVSLEYIEYYCQYVINCYVQPEKFIKIAEFFKQYNEKGGKGGICDMTFCDYINKGMYGADKSYAAENISDLFVNDAKERVLIDSFIGRDFILDSDVRFEMGKSYIDGKIIKKIELIDGVLSARILNGESVKIGSIHFQGNAKALMSDYFCNFVLGSNTKDSL